MELHAYLVFLSGCIIYGLTSGFFYSLGALFPVIMDTFKASRAETSVIQSVFGGVFLGLGIVYGAVTSKIGPKRTAVIGSVVTSAGFIVSFWATSLLYLITTTTVSAVGAGLSFISCTVGMRQHFAGKRGVVALSVGVASSGGSGVALTYLLSYLSAYYGLRGTLLIIGGLQLNGAVLCLLWGKQLGENKDITVVIADKQDAVGNILEAEHSRHPLETTNISDSGIDNPISDTDINDAILQPISTARGEVNVKEDGTTTGTDKKDDKTGLYFIGVSEEITSICTIPTSKPIQTPSNITSEGITTTFSRIKHNILTPSYVFTLLGMTMGSCVLAYPVFLLDMFADNGFSAVEGSTGLVIFNSVSIFGRLTPAILTHCPFYNPFLMPTIATILLCLSGVLILVTKSLIMHFLAFGTIGLGLGVGISVNVVTLSEVVDHQYLPEAIGMSMSVIGTVTIIAGPLTGFIRDESGSYTISHIAMASVNVVAAVMFGLASYYHRQQASSRTIRK